MSAIPKISLFDLGPVGLVFRGDSPRFPWLIIISQRQGGNGNDQWAARAGRVPVVAQPELVILIAITILATFIIVFANEIQRM